MNTIPIHLYSNKKLCILRYKTIEYLPHSKTFYVVSPNSLPLPKNIQMYYTLVSKQYPFVLQDIRKFKDPPATWPPRLGRHHTDAFWTISHHLCIDLVRFLSVVIGVRCQVTFTWSQSLVTERLVWPIGGTNDATTYLRYRKLADRLYFKGGVWGG